METIWENQRMHFKFYQLKIFPSLKVYHNAPYPPFSDHVNLPEKGLSPLLSKSSHLSCILFRVPTTQLVRGAPEEQSLPVCKATGFVFLALWDIQTFDPSSLLPETLLWTSMTTRFFFILSHLSLFADSSVSLAAPFKSKGFQSGIPGLLLLPFLLLEEAIKGIRLGMCVSSECTRMRQQACAHCSQNITLEIRVLAWLDHSCLYNWMNTE